MNYEELLSLKNELKNELIKKEAIEKKLISDMEKENENILKQEKEIEVYEKKKKLIQDAAENAREFSASMFEVVSTEALKTILGENLSVKILFSEKAGTTSAEFKIKAIYEDGREIIVDPTEEDGGGAADIISLASLISMNSFVSDENGAPIILDEPTKFVSKGNSEDVAVFLSETSKNMKKQIIMVTHDEVSKNHADKAYFIKLDEKGVSKSSDITKLNC